MTIIHRSVKGPNPLTRGLSNIVDIFADSKRDEYKIRAAQDKQLTLGEMKELNSLVNNPSLSDDQKEQAKFKLHSKYPKHLRDMVFGDITKSVKEATLNKVLTDHTRLTEKQRRDTLANTMMDFAKTSGIGADYDEFSQSEIDEATGNVQAIMERIIRENPRMSRQEITDIYDKILSDPSNLLEIREVHPSVPFLGGFGSDDIRPRKVGDVLSRIMGQTQQANQQQQQQQQPQQSPQGGHAPSKSYIDDQTTLMQNWSNKYQEYTKQHGPIMHRDGTPYTLEEFIALVNSQ